MAKKKVAATETEDPGYLDYLGIGGDETVGTDEAKGKTGDDDRVAALLKTVEGLTSQVDTMQRDRRYPAAPVAAPVPLVEPKLKEVSFDGLPDQAEHPEEFAKGLNSRIGETMRDNMKALSEFNTASVAAQAQTAGRSDQLWADFKEDYLPRLEKGLPEEMDATPYVEVIARNIASKAVKRGQNLDFYMYQGSFADDVFKETEKILAPFRTGEGEGEGTGTGTAPATTPGTAPSPTAAEVEAHRTGGIIGSSGTKAPATPVAEEKGGLIDDLMEVQRAGGFF